MTGADFDDPPGAQQPDHAIQQFRVSGTIERVLVRKGRHGFLQPGAIQKRELRLKVKSRQKLELLRNSEVDTREAPIRVQGLAQMARVKEGFVVVVADGEQSHRAKDPSAGRGVLDPASPPELEQQRPRYSRGHQKRVRRSYQEAEKTTNHAP